MRSSIRAVTAVAAGGTLLVASWTAATGVASASSTKAPIKIALIDSTTGPAGSEYIRAPQGFLARIALQNAEGGVDGHKIDPIIVNDAGNFTEESSTVQDAVETKGAIGVVSNTPFMSQGYRWLQQNHIPVTGNSADGPEWGEPADTNMFASDLAYVTPNSPATSALSKLLKFVHATSVAALGYSISPLSYQAALNAVPEAEHAGIKAPYINTSVTFGATDFTADALLIKDSGANVVVPDMDDDSNFALIQDLKNAGAKVKGILSTGLEPTAITSSAWTALQGSYFFQPWVPSQLDTPATESMQNALLKYENVPKSDFPDWAVYESWLGADLMIKGLELDGPNPTSTGIITKLRKITDYNGGGLLPKPIDYATVQHKPGQACVYVLEAVKSGFKVLTPKAICGTVIPGTGTKSS